MEEDRGRRTGGSSRGIRSRGSRHTHRLHPETILNTLKRQAAGVLRQSKELRATVAYRRYTNTTLVR